MKTKTLEKFNIWKIIIISIVIIALIVSVLISLKSVTGYFISEHVNTSANLLAAGFFTIGILGATYYLRKMR